jgi:peptidoglycan/xylan/chitin deacetylase (PgdA/CDA1 family)/sulfur carrier protein ThiS
MVGRSFPAASRAVVLVTIAGLSVVACGGSTPQPVPPPSPLPVNVDGVAREVPPGTTFGELVATEGLKASDGRLLSVDGEVLDRSADPGRILLNGRRATGGVVLSSGDRVTIADGEDHLEGTRRIVRALAEPQVGNPERTLDTYPTTQVTVIGRISGVVRSVTDMSRGRGRAPRDVALTFDDGPWPKDTQRVIAVLRRFHVPATFFMVGNLVQRYPHVARAVAEAGFAVGDHSYDHPVSPALADLTDQRIAAEIGDAKGALTSVGASPTLFRPPGGSYDDFVVQEARREGMRVVLWSVDPQDWRSNVTAKEVTRRVLRHVEPGSIILLHDGGDDAAHTIKALPAIIRGIRKMGLGFTMVPARPS